MQYWLNIMDKKICVTGMWHLGIVTAACLSKLGFSITCLDFDNDLIGKLRRGILPIYEPGLKEMIDESVSRGSLSFTSSSAVILESDVVYICYDTPVDKDDILDLSLIDRVISTVIPLLRIDSLIVISSQVPVGTSDNIVKKLRDQGKPNQLCCIPENLRLGDAIRCFLKPDRIVVGLSDSSIKGRVEEIFSGIQAKFLFMSLKSAEMSKHALNSYLGTMISFSGEISNLCERVGANSIDVMHALKEENRVSASAPINPGLGFGGGTLARDIQCLRLIGKKTGLRTCLLDAVLEVNKERMRYVADKLLSIFGTLDGRKIAFFGLTYKAGTDTLRRSLALQIIEQIAQGNLSIAAYDPAIKGQIPEHGYISVAATAEEAAKDSDAIVITTDRDEFKSLDYAAIAKFMKTPVILDAKNLLTGINMGKNIKYYGVGVNHV